MSVTPETAEQDVAFLRRLMDTGDSTAWRRSFGLTYGLWGAVFAAALAPEWARMAGYVSLPQTYWLWAAAIATVGLGLGTFVLARRSPPTVGAQAKALNAVFGGVGCANLAVLASLVLAAYALRDGRVMMIHAIVVFAFQGAAWFAIWSLRKRLWIGLVAAGWYAAAVLAGLTMTATVDFVLVCLAALILLMALPGVLMARPSLAKV